MIGIQVQKVSLLFLLWVLLYLIFPVATRGQEEKQLRSSQDKNNDIVRMRLMAKAGGATELHKHHEIIQYNIKHKLNHSRYTKFVDKLLFKEYCRSKGVRTVPTLASYAQSEYATIPFASFGGDFAIKSNKGSGRNIFIRGDFSNYNVTDIRERISDWGADYTKVFTGEPQYEFTKPRIFIEPLLGDSPLELKTKMYVDEISYIGLKFPTLDGLGMVEGVPLDGNFNILDFSNYQWPFKMPSNLDLLRTLQKDDLNKEYRRMIRVLANDPVLHDLIVYRIDIYYYNHTLFANEITLTSNGGRQVVSLKRKEKKNRNSFIEKMESK